MTSPVARGRSRPGPADPPTVSQDPAGPGEYSCAQAWAALTAAHAQVIGRLSAALQVFGLSINDFEMLLRLDAAAGLVPAGQRLGDLHAAVRLSQPALSRAVARLADRGWLTRSGNPSDGRAVLVTLTPAGRSVLAAAIPVHAAVIRETMLDQLTSAEQEMLSHALSRVAGG
jgi:DNA-binding MarR family transcriptional regulator